MSNFNNIWLMCNRFAIWYIFPMGWLILLTGMFWIDRSGVYHRLFYWFLLLPSLIIIIARYKELATCCRKPIFAASAIFSGYLLLTLLWSDIGSEPYQAIKAPLVILLFMLGSCVYIMHNTQAFERVLLFSALASVVAAMVFLTAHNIELFLYDGDKRLTAYGGRLDNPLLIAHVFGGFACYWMAILFSGEHWSRAIPVISNLCRGIPGRKAKVTQKASKLVPAACLIVILILLLQTGSRTPFIGLSLALLWLLNVNFKRSLFALLVIALLLVVQYKISVAFGTFVGTSYRLEIWEEAIRQISESPWFGHGFKAPFTFQIPGQELYDPHNLFLAVMYETGITGLILWIGIYVCALRFAWNFRQDKLVLIASTWLIFGIGSGLTEGRSFMSLPKEHWFLIWIPLAILFAASALQGKKVPPENTGAKASSGL